MKDPMLSKGDHERRLMFREVVRRRMIRLARTSQIRPMKQAIEYGDVSIRALKALRRLNIDFVHELGKTSLMQLVRLPNVGKTTLNELVAFANAHGITIPTV